MRIASPRDTLISLTDRMEHKTKFAYVSISKGSIISLNKNSDRPFPAKFAKAVLNSVHMQDKNFMKSISNSLHNDLNQGHLSKIGLESDGQYYHSNVFESYYQNDPDTLQIVFSRYFSSYPQLVITLNDPRTVQKNISHKSHIIPVKFSNMYDRLDSIYNQITEFEGGVDYCIMDCGVLGLALSSKIFNNLNMSVIDLGKTITMMKSDYIKRKSYEMQKS